MRFSRGVVRFEPVIKQRVLSSKFSTPACVRASVEYSEAANTVRAERAARARREGERGAATTTAALIIHSYTLEKRLCGAPKRFTRAPAALFTTAALCLGRSRPRSINTSILPVDPRSGTSLALVRRVYNNVLSVS